MITAVVAGPDRYGTVLGVTTALSHLAPYLPRMCRSGELGMREVARKVTEIKIELLPFFTLIAIIGS